MPRKMSPEREKEFDELSQFLEYYCTNIFNISRDDEVHPSNVMVELMERSGKSKAFEGLKQAINDTIEHSLDLDSKSVKKLDTALSSSGIVTLSELRNRYSAKYKKVIKRGSIKNETEYYLINGVLCDQSSDIPNEERGLLSSLIGEFEKNA